MKLSKEKIEQIKNINNNLNKSSIRIKYDIMKKVPKKLRVKLYIKLCTDEQLNQLIESWYKLKDFKMLNLMKSQIEKTNKNYWHTILSEI